MDLLKLRKLHDTQMMQEFVEQKGIKALVVVKVEDEQSTLVEHEQMNPEGVVCLNPLSLVISAYYLWASLAEYLRNC